MMNLLALLGCDEQADEPAEHPAPRCLVRPSDPVRMTS